MELRRKICMLATNDITHDIRVQKEAESAVNAGYNVVVIGLSSSKERLEGEKDGYKIILVPRSFLSIWLRIVKRIVKWILYTFLSDKNNKGGSSVTNKIFKAKLYNQLTLLSFIIFSIKSMRLEAIKQRADIYHANDLDTLSTALKAAKKINAKVLYDAHELWVEQNPEWSNWFKWMAFRFEQRLIKRANMVVTVNSSIGRELEKRYNIGQPIVVYNCPFYFNTRSYQDRNLLKKSIGLNSTQLVVLYQGRYEKGRGLEELVESGLYLSGRVIIILRGYGSIEGELRDKIDKLHLKDRIKFLAPVPTNELVSSAAIADIGVMPYKPTCINNLYATPNKLFEYLMAGLAIVASDLPEIRKIVESSTCGFLFNPEDPKDIANAINKLAENRDLLEENKRNALLAAENTYNWESESEKLINAYALFCK